MTTSALAQALGYRKFPAGRSPRLLLMKADYYIVDDVADAARRLGWDVFELPLATAGQGDADFLQALLRALVDVKPDFLLSINAFGFDESGNLAGLLEDYELPLAIWFVDHPLTILGGASGNARSNAQAFCLERTALPWLADFGFEEPRYLPTASNADVFQPGAPSAAIADGLAGRAVLVGGSWWPRARTRPDRAMIERARELAAAAPHGLNAEFLCDTLPALVAEEDSRGERGAVRDASVALAEASLQARGDLLSALLPLNPVVHGDPHWSELVPGLVPRRPVDPRTELPSIFRASGVNLNVTARQLPTGVNQRVWDVPAAGGFLLTDAQDDVLENFDEGVSCVCWRTPEEARELTQRWLADPAGRARVAAAARERVDAEHRTHHRLLTIERRMRARFAS